MRGHDSYAYNRVISNIKGDIFKEVIKDPALDEMWEVAEKYEEYQRVAETIESKQELEVIKTVSKTTITEYLGLGVERMSVIKKGETMIVLKDHTRIVVPTAMRKTLLEREHLAQSVVTKISNSIRAKYSWPGIKGDMKKMVESCKTCQVH